MDGRLSPITRRPLIPAETFLTPALPRPGIFFAMADCMTEQISREGLYRAVWSEPIKTMAVRLGISDVALAKTCRKHDIPIPPRGHWAKVQSGKRVFRPVLPARGLGMPELLHAGRSRHWHQGICDADLIDAEIPPPPEFPEPIADLLARVTKLVGKVAMVRDLHAPHGLIAGLLRREEEQRKKYSYRADRPLFASPFEQRRLRMLSSIFIALGRCGMRGTLSGNDPSDFGAYVGEQHVAFHLDHPKQQGRSGYRYTDDLKRPASERLVLRISFSSDKVQGVRTEWLDQPGDLVESHLSEVVVNLIVLGEMRYRLGEQHRYDWLVSRKAYLIEEARRRHEEEVRQAREKRIRAEKARVDRLLGEASALRQARDIRAYVEEVRAISANAGAETGFAELDVWSAWALAQAARIDPVLSGAYLRGLPDDEQE